MKDFATFLYDLRGTEFKGKYCQLHPFSESIYINSSQSSNVLIDKTVIIESLTENITDIIVKTVSIIASSSANHNNDIMILMKIQNLFLTQQLKPLC